MAAARPALYREVLTPALHRRFTGSALLVLVFCYVEAILIAEKSSCTSLSFYTHHQFNLISSSHMDMVSVGSNWDQSAAAFHFGPFHLCASSRFAAPRYVFSSQP